MKITMIHLIFTSILSFLLVAQTPPESSNAIDPSLYPEVETSVDRNEILIGDVIHLTVTLTHEPSITIQERSEAIQLDQFRLREVDPKEKQELEDGRIQSTIEYTLSTYFTGEFTIPAFTYRFQTEDGQVGEVQTSPIQIEVRPLTPEESEDLDIRDIKTPVVIETPGRWTRLMNTAVIALYVLCTLFFIWRFLRVLFPKKEKVELIPPEKAHEKAFNELEQLRSDQPWVKTGDFNSFSIGISEIIRVYIYYRWHIPAMDYTSGEIMDALRQQGLDQELLDHFLAFFEECDLIKFAKYAPPMERANNLIGTAREVVDKTKMEEILAQEETEQEGTEEALASLFSAWWGDPSLPLEIRFAGSWVQLGALVLIFYSLFNFFTGSFSEWPIPLVQVLIAALAFWFGRGLSFGYRISAYYFMKDFVFSLYILAMLFAGENFTQAYFTATVIVLFLLTPVVFAYIHWKELH